MNLKKMITGQVKPHHEGLSTIMGDFNPGNVCRVVGFASTCWNDASDVKSFLPNGEKGFFTSVKDRFNKSKTRGEVLEKVRAELSKIIAAVPSKTPSMQGYSVESRVTDAVMDDEMVAFKMTLDVNMDYVRTGKDNPLIKDEKTFREEAKEYWGVELPETIAEHFYFLAPKGKMRAVIQAMHAMASQEFANEKFVTVEPLNVHEVVALQTVSEEKKSNLGVTPIETTWFDMDNFFFMTIDREVYNRLITSFNADVVGEDPDLEKKMNAVISKLKDPKGNAKGGIKWPKVV